MVSLRNYLTMEREVLNRQVVRRARTPERIPWGRVATEKVNHNLNEECTKGGYLQGCGGSVQ